MTATLKPLTRTILRRVTGASQKPAKQVQPVARVGLHGFNLRTPKSNSIFVVATRPRGGALLYAHTHAALMLLGLLNEDRPAIPRTAVETVMGKRAVDNHLAEANFQQVGHGIRLTPGGRVKFLSRVTEGKFNMDVANAFTDLFIDGTISPLTGVPPSGVHRATFTA